MKNLVKNLFAGLLAMLIGFNAAWAAKDPNGPGDGPSACEGLRIATGPKGKGYSKLFSDMSKISVGSNLKLCEVTTEGGLDNLTVLSTKGADIAIVPLDALKTLSAGDENIAGLLAVAPLNSNFLHIVVAEKGYTIEGPKKLGGMMKGDLVQVYVNKMSDLKGANVAAVGTAQLLVRQLNKQLGLNMVIGDYNGADADRRAMNDVTLGKVAASFTIASWPAGPIKALQPDSGIKLAQFDMPINGAYNVRPFTYKNIGAYNVQALSVQNVLVTRPFSAGKMQQVVDLKRLLMDKLTDLKDGDFEPAWNEIKSVDAKVDWQMMQTPATAAPPRKK